MPEEYRVQLDHEESSEENCAISGRVNDQQCAVVIRNSKFLGKSAKEQRRIKQVALAMAYKDRAAAVVGSASGETVRL